VFLLLFLDTGCVHLISLMWLEDVIASSSPSDLFPERHFSKVFQLKNIRKKWECLGKF